MRSPSLLTLTALALIALVVAPAAFSSSAAAATAQARQPQQDQSGSPKRHRAAHSACQPTSMYFGGQRVCVHPTPYTYSTDPVSGQTQLLWPR